MVVEMIQNPSSACFPCLFVLSHHQAEVSSMKSPHVSLGAARAWVALPNAAACPVVIPPHHLPEWSCC